MITTILESKQVLDLAETEERQFEESMNRQRELIFQHQAAKYVG